MPYMLDAFCQQSFPGKGYAFLIAPTDLPGQRIFLHVTSVVDGQLPARGQRVVCLVEPDDRGFRATRAVVRGHRAANDGMDGDDDGDGDGDSIATEDLMDELLGDWRETMGGSGGGNGGPAVAAAARAAPTAAMAAAVAPVGVGAIGRRTQRPPPAAAPLIADVGGFSTEWFVHPEKHEPVEVDSDLVCGVCLDVQRDAVLVVNCGHSFCRTCMTQHIQARQGNFEELSCPMCREAFEDDAHVFDDKRNRRKINQLTAKCPECEFVGRVDAFVEHPCVVQQQQQQQRQRRPRRRRGGGRRDRGGAPGGEVVWTTEMRQLFATLNAMRL